MTATDRRPASPAPETGGFWQRRVVAPLREQLRRGVTPAKLALTVGVGTTCSVFPFLGFTSLLNLGAGALLQLNHALLQLWNQLLGPVQLALIVVYVRAGEWLHGAEAQPFTVEGMIAVFRSGSIGDFLAEFGRAGWHALSAWLASAPLLIAGLFLLTRPVFRAMQRRLKA